MSKDKKHSSEDVRSCDCSEVGNGWKNSFLKSTVKELIDQINEFGEERQWQRFHTPRNLQLAVINEIGELAQIFQFMGDEIDHTMSMNERFIVGLELADITMYLLRLTEACSLTDAIVIG